MNPLKFSIFLIVPNFLRSYKAVRQLMSQLVYDVCYNRYQVLFYLRRIGPALKHIKVSKIYDQVCRVMILDRCL